MQNPVFLPRIRITSGYFRLLSALAICTGLFGCQLPNVGPFVDATSQLKGAIASSGSAVELELRLIPGGEEKANLLKENWAARDRAMSALLSYAQSLDAIVAAGESGSESAEKIADSVTNLAKAAGVVIPAAPAAIDVANDTIKLLSFQIATVRAANSLSRALEEAQPAVGKIVELMRKDLGDLDVIIQAAHQLSDTAAAAEMSASGLQDQRKSILEATKKLDVSKKEDRETLVQLSQLRTEMEIRYAAYEAKLKANAERSRASRQLVNAATVALDAWIDGHAQLAVAARNKTSVSTRALTDATIELRDLVKKIRELR